MARIKEKHPQAQITFITFDANRGFLERNNNLEHIIYFSLTTNLIYIFQQTVSIISRLRRAQFDVVINFEIYNYTAAVFTYLLRIPMRIGLNSMAEAAVYTHPVEYNVSGHISSVFASLLKPLGIDVPYAYEPLCPDLKEVERVSAWLHEKGMGCFVGIHPGTSCNFRGKQYAQDRWVVLARELMARHGVGVVLTGAPVDQSYVEKIRRAIGQDERVLNAAGIFNMGELAVLMQKSRVYISSDTGPAHLAASMGVNVAVFYGPASPERYGPLNANSLVFYKREKCSPCVGGGYLNRKCPYHYRCLDYDPRFVAEKISKRFFNAQTN
ncbi:MAG: glycosyltransferase family 9 protein [Candidatus Omnitrophota bacterium]